MNMLLAPSSPTGRIKLQSLSKVMTLNDITYKPANTQIGQGDVIISWSIGVNETVETNFSGARPLPHSATTATLTRGGTRGKRIGDSLEFFFGDWTF